MLSGRVVRTAVVAAFLGLLSGPLGEAAQLVMRIGGTGSALPGIRLVAEAYKRQNRGRGIVVLPSLGSSGGIKALAAGELDMALSARPLRAEEASKGLAATAYAWTPFVFAAGPECPLDALTTSQVVDLYQGATTQWPDGRRIRLVLRPPADSDNDVLRGLSPEIGAAVDAALARPGMIIGVTDQDAAELLERLPGAFGVTTLALVRSEGRRVKVLALDGIAPSVKALASGRYPYHKVLYLVTGSHPPDEVRRFRKFLTSPTARGILTEHGHLAFAAIPP